MKNNKILITGGAGFIGSHLADNLAAKKYDICVFDNLHRGSLENLKNIEGKIKFVKGDIRDYDDINNAMKNSDIVFHLAAQPNVIGSINEPDYTFTTNVLGTLNVLKAAFEHKIKKFIFTSSREVYGDPKYTPVDEKHPLNPKNLYGKTKVGSEILCSYFRQYFNLDAIIIRIANVYGPRDRERVIPAFIDNLKRNRDLTVYGGQQILDFIWVGDVIGFLVRAMENKFDTGKIFNLGTGIGTTIMNLASLMISLSSSKSKIIKEEKRAFDVESFVADVKNLDIKTKKLEEGLKILLSINK